MTRDDRRGPSLTTGKKGPKGYGQMDADMAPSCECFQKTAFRDPLVLLVRPPVGRVPPCGRRFLLLGHTWDVRESNPLPGARDRNNLRQIRAAGYAYSIPALMAPRRPSITTPTANLARLPGWAGGGAACGGTRSTPVQMYDMSKCAVVARQHRVHVPHCISLTARHAFKESARGKHQSDPGALLPGLL
ncbi:hypothetical protein MRX96_035628 [Rhipicephalus microplus]